MMMIINLVISSILIINIISLALYMALDDYNDDGDDSDARFGEVRLVVRQATGQQYAAKTIQARLVCLIVN